MAVPTSISELSTTPGSNPPSGSDSPTVTDDHFRAGYSFIKELSDDKAEDDEVVKLTGDQTIAGVKTFSSTIAGSISGNAATATTATNAQGPAASTTVAGVVELATAEEAPIRSNTAVALTPATLRDALHAQNDAPIYACRAWVNFNGTGTVAIRASGNVSSITDNGTGDYTINLTTALPDANYAAPITGGGTTSAGSARAADEVTPRTASALRIFTLSTAPALQDQAQISVAFFR